MSEARPKVYVAGPLSRGNRVRNVAQGMEAYVTLLEKGYAPFLPHFSALMEWMVTGMEHSDWLEADLPWVRCSDALLRLPGESVGADMEEAHAKAHGIPIFYNLGRLLEAIPTPKGK